MLGDGRQLDENKVLFQKDPTNVQQGNDEHPTRTEVMIEQQQANELGKIVDACHVQNKEVKVLKTWRNWVKDPNLYEVQTCRAEKRVLSL